MSYILDALRRAEAERERGAVPSLQSQQHSIESDDDDAPARSRLLVWAVIALVIALVATLAWTFLGGAGTPARPIAEGSVTSTPALVAPALTPVAPTPPVAQTVPQVAATTATPTAPTAVPIPPPAPTIATVMPPAPAPKAVPRTALAAPKADRSAARDTSASSGASGTRAATAASGTATEARVYALSELPEEVRREVPRLTINGASYSGDAASRMVMINGQIFHEGDRLAAGLVLEKIKLRSAVLAYKGWRYEITF